MGTLEIHWDLQLVNSRSQDFPSFHNCVRQFLIHTHTIRARRRGEERRGEEKRGEGRGAEGRRENIDSLSLWRTLIQIILNYITSIIKVIFNLP